MVDGLLQGVGLRSFVAECAPQVTACWGDSDVELCEFAKGRGCIKIVNRSKGSGRVAQLGERVLCKHEVAGSIPVTSTKIPNLTKASLRMAS